MVAIVVILFLWCLRCANRFPKRRRLLGGPSVLRSVMPPTVDTKAWMIRFRPCGWWFGAVSC